MSLNHIPLSDQGEQRRAAMLETLVEVMTRFHRRKRIRKIVGGATLALVAGWIAIGAWLLAHSVNDQPLANRGKSKPHHAPIATNPGGPIVGSRPLLQKYCVQNKIRSAEPYVTNEIAGTFARVEILTDDALVTLYQQAGTDGFVAVINHQKVFMTNKNKADKKKDVGM